VQGVKRKVIHATLYEALAIVIVTVATARLGWADHAGAATLALITSAMAMSWNMAFNTLFEAWERRQREHARTPLRRMAHAIGFEGGLVVLTVPVLAWWLHMSWWQALLADLTLVLFFLVYTVVFNWLFDHVFGLPHATPGPYNP
jgi:uncharacterized membrane protein